MNYRVVVGLLLLVIIGEAASPYLTSVLSSASEAGTASLVISNTNSSGGYSYANTTVTYLQSYSFVPNVAYAIDSLSYSNTPYTTGGPTTRNYDVSLSSRTISNFQLTANFTANKFSGFTIKYLAISSTSPYFDVQLNSATFPTSGSGVGFRTSSTRSSNMVVSYRNKSSTANAVVLYFTVGITMSWSNTTRFSFTMVNSTMLASNYTLVLTVQSQQAITFIRVCTINYELLLLPSGDYFDYLIGTTNTTGNVPQNSATLGKTDFSTIFTGLVDFTFDQTITSVKFQISVSGNAFQVSGYLVPKTSYFWYRRVICPDSYYIDLATSQCNSCHYSCATCNNSNLNSQCLTCASSNYRTYSSGFCRCQTDYLDIGLASCSYAICDSTCLTCSNMYICASCNSSLYRSLVLQRCPCIDRYYDDSPNLPCLACNYSCLTCTTNTACVTCSATDFRIFDGSSNQCLCLEGYYDKGVAVCVVCHYSCQSCSSDTSCKTCDATNQRYITTANVGYCLCSVGYYDDGSNQLCVSCPYYCSNCTSATECVTCISSTTRVLAGGKCNCVSTRYYDDLVNAACQSCDYSCQACTNSTACSACNASNFRVLNASLSPFCSCMPYYFQATASTELCITCAVTCNTCSSSASTGCLSCNATAYRQLSTTGACLCMTGYYQTSSNVELCSACSYKCLTCTNNTVCATCGSEYYRQNLPANSCPCDNGYFDAGSKLCSKCNHQCLTCTGSSACLTCDSTTRETNDLVNCPCKTGFFDNGVDSTCSTCLSTCLACTNLTACTSCNPTHNRTIDSNGGCICNARTVDVAASSPICQSCHYSCVTCSGTTKTTCKSCDTGSFRWLSSGSCLCLDGYYDDGTNEICKECHYSCEKCINASNCTACNPAMYRTTTNPTTGFCSCSVRYFDDTVGELCQNCHYSCATCTDLFECTSCNTSANRVSNPDTFLCDCNVGYNDNGVEQLCSTCQYTCATCTLGSTACLSCNSAYHRTTDGSDNCPCDAGYYDNQIAMCASCHYSCLTCQSITSCLTCSTDNHRVLDLYCICTDGYYNQASNPICQTCSYTCLTCYNSTMCLTCNVSNFRQLSSLFQCSCIDGYYDNTVALCVACDPSCLTCSTGAACLSCDASKYRILNASTSKCDCFEGYYSQGGSLTCSACDYTCSNCTNSVSCTSCNSSNFRTPSGPSCVCQSGYYDDGFSAKCLPCHYSCQTCTNSTQCDTACSSIHHRTYSASTLLCSCDSKFYDDGVNKMCSACLYVCSTCENVTTCLTCDSEKHRIYNTVTDRCQCEPGYYDDTTNELCMACQVSCITCLNGISCDTCNLVQFRKSTPITNGLCACLDGYYDSGQAVCQPCLYSCLKCTAASVCSECDSTTHRTLSATTCPCDTGFFDTLTNTPTCAPCSTKCLTCVNSTNYCLTCNDSNFRTLSATSNTCVCTARYYDDGINVKCAACLYYCATCTNGSRCETCSSTASRYMASNGQCACLAGYYDVVGTQACVACSYTCGTCSVAGSCSTCAAGSHRTLSGSSCLCDQYYYDDLSNRICKNCAYYCSSCTVAIACTSCDGTKMRVSNSSTNKCDCQPTYYDDQLGNELCLKCHYSCLECSNSSACTTCDSATNHRAILSVSTLCSCMLGYYDDGTHALCKPCILGCLTCTNSTGCISCNGTDYRVANLVSKLCECKSGYYSDEINSKCLQCPYDCWSCNSTSTCTSCNTTYFRIINASTFRCSCEDGYYDDATHMLCLNCHYSCQTCTSSGSCITCSSANHRTPGTTTCLCSTGYYDDGSSSACQPCSAACLTCNGTANNCTSCEPSYNRAGSNCDCETSYFSVLGVSVCSKCQYTCQTCTSGSSCVQCNATKFRQKLLGGAYCTCLNKYYDDGLENELCLPCLHSCSLCDRASNCTSCNSSMHRVSAAGGQCVCDVKYYDDGINELCLACHFSCSTCTTQYCDVCDATMHRQTNATSKLCDCSTGYYSYNNQEKCLLCNPSCETCSNGLSCNTCIHSNFRMLISGANALGVVNPYCPCFDRYYPSTPVVCAPCHYTCFLCGGPSNTSCTYCNATSHRQLSSQSCVCSAGFYHDGSHELCLTCDISCKQCTGPSNSSCQACVTSYFLLSTTCYGTCPDTYFGNTTSSICQACSTNCKSCTNSTVCTVCADTYLLQALACVSSCSTGYFADTVGGVAACSTCRTNCTSCTALSTCTACKQQFYLSSGNCLSCSVACNGCTGPNQNQCTNCFYPLYLRISICESLTCAANQYVSSLEGCKDCTTLVANSYSCNNTAALSCELGYKLMNTTYCALCSLVAGYHIDTSKQCSEVCGDGLRIELPCDDGNTLDGDGCSSSCRIEDGWSCNSASPSVCQLNSNLTANIYQQQKVAGRNRVAVYLNLSISLRLTTRNFIFRYNSKQSQPKELNELSLTRYKITVQYDETVQDMHAQLMIVLYSQARRLLNTVNYLNISFPFAVSTYPPAVYYQSTAIDNVDRLYSFCRVIGLATLVVCCLACLMAGKSVHDAIQTLNFIVLVFLTQGYSLDGFADWTQYLIEGLKEASLVGGFTITPCSNCVDNDAELRYSYQPLFSQNGGIVFTINLTLLGILLVVTFIAFMFKKHQISNTCLNKFKSWLSYYTLAFLLGFNTNELFSAVLYLRYVQFDTPVQIGNFIMALITIIIHISFTIGLGRWSRQLNKQYIHPVEVVSKQTIENERQRKSSLTEAMEAESVNGVMKEQELRPASPVKSIEREFDKDEDLILSYDLSSVLKSEMTAANYYNLLSQLRNTFVVVLIAVMQDQPVAKFAMILVINSLYLAYLAAVRPFNSLMNNVRILVLEGVIEAFLIMDVAACATTVYSFGLEVLLIIAICVGLLFNLLVIIVQIVQANESWLTQRLRPWMMHYRSKKKYALENRDRVGADSRMTLHEPDKLEDLEKVHGVDIIANIFDQQHDNDTHMQSESGTEGDHRQGQVPASKDFFQQIVEKKQLRGEIINQYRNGRRFRTASRTLNKK